MRELVLTRHNALIDPLVSVWRWQIPVYLFLGGWVAGMMIIVGYFLFRGRQSMESSEGIRPWIARARIPKVDAGILQRREVQDRKCYKILLCIRSKVDKSYS